MVMPVQKPGKSEQVVCTPKNFLKAVKNRFYLKEGFAYDLAADADNTVAEQWFDEEADALVQDWHQIKGISWCNPPFGDLEPWVAKAVLEANKGADLLMLLPASVGSNWWRSFVDSRSRVYFLNGRLTFVGHKSPYPKDLALVHYHRVFMECPGYTVWNWRENL